MKKFLDNWLKVYADKDTFVKSRARFMAIYMLIAFVSLIPFSLTMLVLGAVAASIILAICVLGYFVGFLFLRFGALEAIVWCILIGLGLIFISFSATSPASEAETFYTHLTFALFNLIVASLFAQRTSQFYTVAAIHFIFLVVLSIQRLVPNLWQTNRSLIIMLWISFFIEVGLALFILVLVHRTFKKNIVETQKIAENTQKKFEQLRVIASSAANSLHAGESLTASAQNTLLELSALETQTQELKEGFSKVKNQLISIENVTNEVVRGNGAVRSHIEAQAGLVQSSGAAIEEMVSSVNNVAKISESRRAPLQKLLETAQLGTSEMKKAMESMQTMEKSSSGVMDLVKIILSVAAQTNLLAMNAAIEAAHAGEAGAGFAVVAAEIRKLSESTRLNTKSITDYLKENQKQIREAVQVNERVGDFFDKIDQEIRTMASAIEEILNAMGELSEAGNSVLAQVSQVQNGTRSIVDSSEDVNVKMLEQANSIPEIVQSYGRVEEAMSQFQSRLERVRKEAESVDRFGKTGLSELEKIEKDLSSV